MALSFFTFMDRSSEESIKINLRLPITSENWSDKKELFIEERFSQRKHEAWNHAKWAEQELKYLNSLEFEEEDRRDLRDMYSSELVKISKGRTKAGEQELRFKWKAEKQKLKLLYDKLKEGRYIQAKRKEFEQLFNEQEASSIKPIEWRANHWELAYLIEYLLQKYLIEKGNYIQGICHCFIKENGEPFKESSIKSQMNQARQGIAGSNQKKKKIEELIDSLVSQ